MGIDDVVHLHIVVAVVLVKVIYNGPVLTAVFVVSCKNRVKKSVGDRRLPARHPIRLF